MAQEYRVYADNSVVHENDFNEYDHAQPFYDDYAVYEVPDGDEDVELRGIPEVLRDHILENRDMFKLTVS